MSFWLPPSFWMQCSLVLLPLMSILAPPAEMRHAEHKTPERHTQSNKFWVRDTKCSWLWREATPVPLISANMIWMYSLNTAALWDIFEVTFPIISFCLGLSLHIPFPPHTLCCAEQYGFVIHHFYVRDVGWLSGHGLKCRPIVGLEWNNKAGTPVTHCRAIFLRTILSFRYSSWWFCGFGFILLSKDNEKMNLIFFSFVDHF